MSKNQTSYCHRYQTKWCTNFLSFVFLKSPQGIWKLFFLFYIFMNLLEDWIWKAKLEWVHCFMIRLLEKALSVACTNMHTYDLPNISRNEEFLPLIPTFWIHADRVANIERDFIFLLTKWVHEKGSSFKAIAKVKIFSKSLQNFVLACFFPKRHDFFYIVLYIFILLISMAW